jgi:hypothetical protein
MLIGRSSPRAILVIVIFAIMSIGDSFSIGWAQTLSPKPVLSSVGGELTSDVKYFRGQF